MQDVASSEIDNQVMRKAGDAKVVGKLYGLDAPSTMPRRSFITDYTSSEMI